MLLYVFICHSFSVKGYTQSYWKQYLTNHDGNGVYQLPLDFILKNSVALSYMLDFMADRKSQAYVFFILNVEGDLSSSKFELNKFR